LNVIEETSLCRRGCVAHDAPQNTGIVVELPQEMVAVSNSGKAVSYPPLICRKHDAYKDELYGLSQDV
jgi:hypothetical protein